MKIVDFRNLIKNLPYEYHSFDINDNWKFENQVSRIASIFNQNKILTLNRKDLMNQNLGLEEFIIKVLMWGYPTKGRGNNIKMLLEKRNFQTLVSILENYKNADTTLENLKRDIKGVTGLGLSTMTKFIYFLNAKVENQKALVLDLQVIDAINLNKFKELNTLIGISYQNALNGSYLDYLKVLADLSVKMACKPDQIEMFLFMFGKNISEISD